MNETTAAIEDIATLNWPDLQTLVGMLSEEGVGMHTPTVDAIIARGKELRPEVMRDRELVAARTPAFRPGRGFNRAQMREVARRGRQERKAHAKKEGLPWPPPREFYGPGERRRSLRRVRAEGRKTMASKLNEQGIRNLKELAKEAKLPGYGRMRRAGLVKALLNRAYPPLSPQEGA